MVGISPPAIGGSFILIAMTAGRQCFATRPHTLAVLSADRGAVICERCELADRPLSRLRGLLGRHELRPGDGMLLRPSSSVHTFFMRFPIDVVFLDAELRVLGVRRDLRPWWAAAERGAHAVLELAAGEAERRGLAPGEDLRLNRSLPSPPARHEGGAGSGRGSAARSPG